MSRKNSKTVRESKFKRKKDHHKKTYWKYAIFTDSKGFRKKGDKYAKPAKKTM